MRDQLKARVTAAATVLLAKNPVALKATKDAVRRVSVLSYAEGGMSLMCFDFSRKLKFILSLTKGSA